MTTRSHIRGSDRWAALEIRLLAAFVAVVEHGSFTGAARQLGYTQSGISQQIAALERIVDRKLLVRQYGRRMPVELTPAGTSLLEHCRAVLRQVDRAYTEVGRSEDMLRRVVRVAAFSSAAVHLVPRLRRDLHRDGNPRLELVEEQTDFQLFAHLDSGAAELAFAVLPVPGRFVAERIGADPYVAVVPTRSPLARGSALRPGDLTDQPLLGITRCEHEDAVAAELAGYGVDSANFERYDDNRLIQSLVAGGNGIAIVPSLTVDRTDDAVRVLEILAELPPRTIALIYPRDVDLSAAALRFKEIALPLAKEILARATSHATRSHAARAGDLGAHRGKLTAA